MKFSSNDKLGIVAGGGAGIGQAICSAFAEHGPWVHILELQKNKAATTAQSIV